MFNFSSPFMLEDALTRTVSGFELSLNEASRAVDSYQFAMRGLYPAAAVCIDDSVVVITLQNLPCRALAERSPRSVRACKLQLRIM